MEDFKQKWWPLLKECRPELLYQIKNMNKKYSSTITFTNRLYRTEVLQWRSLPPGPVLLKPSLPVSERILWRTL